MNKDFVKTQIGIILIIIFFLIISFIIQNNIDYIKSLIGSSPLSMIIFVLILIMSTVLAPVSELPLLPIASNVWGWFITGILSIIGWTLGSLIAFGLARRYGSILVNKLVSLDQIAKYERLIPEENIFLSVVFLRMSIPVDVLSYILGLFSRIKFRTYLFATLIGVAPFAFIWSYLGTLPIQYQLLGITSAIVIILTGYVIRKGYKKRKERKGLSKKI